MDTNIQDGGAGMNPLELMKMLTGKQDDDKESIKIKKIDKKKNTDGWIELIASNSPLSNDYISVLMKDEDGTLQKNIESLMFHSLDDYFTKHAVEYQRIIMDSLFTPIENTCSTLANNQIYEGGNTNRFNEKWEGVLVNMDGPASYSKYIAELEPSEWVQTIQEKRLEDENVKLENENKKQSDIPSSSDKNGLFNVSGIKNMFNTEPPSTKIVGLKEILGQMLNNNDVKNILMNNNIFIDDIITLNYEVDMDKLFDKIVKNPDILNDVANIPQIKEKIAEITSQSNVKNMLRLSKLVGIDNTIKYAIKMTKDAGINTDKYDTEEIKTIVNKILEIVNNNTPKKESLISNIWPFGDKKTEQHGGSDNTLTEINIEDYRNKFVYDFLNEYYDKNKSADSVSSELINSVNVWINKTDICRTNEPQTELTQYGTSLFEQAFSNYLAILSADDKLHKYAKFVINTPPPPQVGGKLSLPSMPSIPKPSIPKLSIPSMPNFLSGPTKEPSEEDEDEDQTQYPVSADFKDVDKDKIDAAIKIKLDSILNEIIGKIASTDNIQNLVLHHISRYINLKDSVSNNPDSIPYNMDSKLTMETIKCAKIWVDSLGEKEILHVFFMYLFGEKHRLINTMINAFNKDIVPIVEKNTEEKEPKEFLVDILPQNKNKKQDEEDYAYSDNAPVADMKTDFKNNMTEMMDGITGKLDNLFSSTNPAKKSDILLNPELITINYLRPFVRDSANLIDYYNAFIKRMEQGKYKDIESISVKSKYTQKIIEKPDVDQAINPVIPDKEKEPKTIDDNREIVKSLFDMNVGASPDIVELVTLLNPNSQDNLFLNNENVRYTLKDKILTPFFKDHIELIGKKLVEIFNPQSEDYIFILLLKTDTISRFMKDILDTTCKWIMMNKQITHKHTIDNQIPHLIGFFIFHYLIAYLYVASPFENDKSGDEIITYDIKINSKIYSETMDEYLKIVGNKNILRNYINNFIHNAKCPCHPEKPLEMNSLEQSGETPHTGGKYRTQKKKHPKRKRKTKRRCL